MSRISKEVINQAKQAQEAARIMAGVPTATKNQALLKIAEELEKSMVEILAVNEKEVLRGQEKGLAGVLLERLKLTEQKIRGMAEGLRKLAYLEDPIGEVPKMWRRPNGLQIGQIRVPLGVIGIIYESRPNVTVDAAGLCLKAGNAVILRGGSEAFDTNQTLHQKITVALSEAGLPVHAVQLIQTVDREAVEVLLGLNEYLDVLIPRGGPALIKRVLDEARVPVIQTGAGNCHIYVDSAADLDMALKIVFNAKTDYVSVCNAAESLLVHQMIAAEFLPQLYDLFQANGVQLRGCNRSLKLVSGIFPADKTDWGKEYLDYIMSVKIVDSIEEAVKHINTYGTGHSEAIVTDNYNQAWRFLQEVDSAAVYVNASTRFTDGGQFGLGAEIGISTQKLHARGPMGLKELTTTKYIILGQGQIRE
ncbi:MAG: glutamate-5-semialdehyde dehydrogenase [Clostridiales bacterium]|nr:glutamate-5-semialdehyde dehydrogenase [Clostridiales bacterium]